jgi:glutathione S-transferase
MLASSITRSLDCDVPPDPETPMLTLCGFPLSNYYNKVKMVLLEKQLPFTEERITARDGGEAMLAASPLGKVPFIRTEHGALSESQAIVDYVEARWPEPRLVPADPWARAKLAELVTYIDLHLELVAREMYPQAFFGGTLSEAGQARVRRLLVRHIAGFKRLARFSPYVAGDTFTQADCVAYVSLPLVALSSKLVLGDDLLAAAGVDWKAYVKLIAPRPSAQRVDADRKADQARRAAAGEPAPI